MRKDITELRIFALGAHYCQWLHGWLYSSPYKSLLRIPVDPWHYETATEKKIEAGRISHSF